MDTVYIAVSGICRYRQDKEREIMYRHRQIGSARYIAAVATESVFPWSALQRERVSKYN